MVFKSTDRYTIIYVFKNVKNVEHPSIAEHFA
jgi:hypothetical protein